MAILYVETSLVMSAAMGRDADALSLIQNCPPRHTLAVPAACLMESLSAFQRERSGYNDFENRLKQQANQLLRDKSSFAAAKMQAHLQQASVELANLQNDVQTRLIVALEKLVHSALLIQSDPRVVSLSLQTQHLRQLTDNLILHTVLSHASADAAERPRALLTGNDFNDPQIRTLLTNAGITELWATATEAFDWLDKLP